MKVDRIIKISEKFTTYVPHLDELYLKETLDKTISISKDVKHPPKRIDGYSHIMTKSERRLRSF